ncbi:MAG: hypothetical protein ACYTKD_08425 [Planctomycetota bacterium]|jgi:hypothetical protein
MPARARIESLVILDELVTRMRRTAARLSMLAGGVTDSAATPEGAGVAAAHLEGASALSGHVPELKPVADRLAEAVAALEPRPGMPPETAARIALAELGRASAGDEEALERAAAWARRLSSPEGAEGAPEPGSLGPRAALALAKAAAVTGEARFREAAEREIAGLPRKGEDAGAVAVARALVALGGEEALALAREACDRISFCRADGSAESAGSDPAATAEGVLLACDLWAAERDSRHLDAVERATLKAGRRTIRSGRRRSRRASRARRGTRSRRTRRGGSSRGSRLTPLRPSGSATAPTCAASSRRSFRSAAGRSGRSSR